MSQDLNKDIVHKDIIHEDIILSTTGYVYRPKEIHAYDEDILEYILDVLRLSNQELGKGKIGSSFENFYIKYCVEKPPKDKQ